MSMFTLHPVSEKLIIKGKDCGEGESLFGSRRGDLIKFNRLLVPSKKNATTRSTFDIFDQHTEVVEGVGL